MSIRWISTVYMHHDSVSLDSPHEVGVMIFGVFEHDEVDLFSTRW